VKRGKKKVTVREFEIEVTSPWEYGGGGLRVWGSRRTKNEMLEGEPVILKDLAIEVTLGEKSSI